MRRQALGRKRFGRLTVTDDAERAGPYVTCLCDCGKIKDVFRSSLRSGRTRSCGCLRVASNVDRTVHGHTRHGRESPEYLSWRAMLCRTSNPKDRRFADYGGRGITVCERWLKFENFFADMGSRPPGLTLDRRNNDGNYEPGNCRWATRRQQARNTRELRTTNISGARGVSWNVEHQKWEARIYRDRKHIFLGYFSDVASASVAYQKYRRCHDTPTE